MSGQGEFGPGWVLFDFYFLNKSNRPSSPTNNRRSEMEEGNGRVWTGMALSRGRPNRTSQMKAEAQKGPGPEEGGGEGGRPGKRRAHGWQGQGGGKSG